MKQKIIAGLKLVFIGILSVIIGFKLLTYYFGPYKNIDAKEFHDLSASQDAVILDVRTPGEYKTGFVPGAKNINYYSDDFSEEISALNPSKSFLIYCKSGNRSSKTAALMAKKGFKNLYNLNDGFPAWKSAGFKVETP